MKVTPRLNARFLTLRVAEQEYGIPYSRLYQWVMHGRLAALDRTVSERSILIRRADLDAFLEGNMTTVRS